MFEKGFVDAHCHLANQKLANDLLSNTRNKQIKGFISAAMTTAEINWHRENAHTKIAWIAGRHPLFTEDESFTFDLLQELCQQKEIIGIGEIGMDKRSENQQYQRDILLQQLEIARDFDLPVIFHVVKEYYTLAKLLKENFPQVRGYLHGFHSSIEVVELMKDFDLTFSLNCRPPKPELIRYLAENGNYLFETDSPFQKPIGSDDKYNTPANLEWIINYFSQVSKLPINVIEEAQNNTFRKIFG